MDHYTLAYVMFLEGKDMFPEEEKILEARYGTYRCYTMMQCHPHIDGT